MAAVRLFPNLDLRRYRLREVRKIKRRDVDVVQFSQPPEVGADVPALRIMFSVHLVSEHRRSTKIVRDDLRDWQAASRERATDGGFAREGKCRSGERAVTRLMPKDELA